MFVKTKKFKNLRWHSKEQLVSAAKAKVEQQASRKEEGDKYRAEFAKKMA